MAARSNLVIKDRTTPTPADHTFTPDGDDANGVHVFSEKTSVPAGNARFTASLTQTKTGRITPKLKLSIPVVATQTINGISSPAIIRTAYVEVSANFDALSTAQERADAIGLMANAMATAQTQINDLLVNVSDIY